jgi:hypothetical protein
MADEPRPKPSAPATPDELWMLWNAKASTWVPAMDCAGDPWLSFETKADAEESAQYHSLNFEIDCVPVCVKLSACSK